MKKTGLKIVVLIAWSGLVNTALTKNKGIQNPDARCFMNSSLQALSHMPNIVPILQEAQKQLTDANKKNINGTLINVINSLHSQGNTPISVNNLNALVRNNYFGRTGQEDAAEFLFEKLFLDLKPAGFRCSLFLKDVIKYECAQDPKNKHYYYNIEQKDIQNHDPETYFALDIPDQNQKITLRDLLKKADEIPEDYKCETCKKKNTGGIVRRIHIASALTKPDTASVHPPDALIVQLRRFFKLGGGDAHKINTPVTDFLEFTLPIAYTNERERYQLFAIVLQSGSLAGGHYIAAAKDANDSWNLYNDSSVSDYSKGIEKINAEGVDSGFTPYILFYKRKNVLTYTPPLTVQGAEKTSSQPKPQATQPKKHPKPSPKKAPASSLKNNAITNLLLALKLKMIRLLSTINK
ncbi:MAG: ubiquitin carboxyl-terminal hydrolase [Epsilonproteobacteria bacterium]|nr:ubiquitin carboxyl-terminal hydrolase [Campylobacterota bacterium]